MSASKRLRCAVYTRKSTEEGLEQNFNSLAAQRTACEAYIASQAGEGWKLIKTAFDDGGFSGGTMDRPALQALLAMVDAGEVDVIVVYKVDRLTRSLMDFARIVERLDAKGVSFVSVTQSFNTTSSMGRLTLNVLLSFAQFEREITGERIRDKIALSKTRGLWMGGRKPLGYDADGRVLIVSPHEAAIVRDMFSRFLELGSVRALREELRARGVVSKRVTTQDGRVLGGLPIWTGALRYILTNRTYLGEIRHGAVWHPGQHEPIVSQEVFEAVDALLAQGRAPRRRAIKAVQRPLLGIAFDDANQPLTPSHTVQRQGRRYDYYVSHALVRGDGKGGSLPRIAADAFEREVMDACVRVFEWPPDWSAMRPKLNRVVLSRATIRIEAAVANDDPDACLARVRPDERLDMDAGHALLIIPTRARPWAGRSRGFTANGKETALGEGGDLSLLTAIAMAHAWRADWASGQSSIAELARRERVDPSYALRIIRLAYLAPDVTRAILEGSQPPSITVTSLMAMDAPLDWAAQRRKLGLNFAGGAR